MRTLEEMLNEQVLDEATPLIVNELQGVAREKGLEIACPKRGWAVGECLSLSAGQQSFVIRRVEPTGTNTRLDSAILFSLPDGQHDNCFLARTSNGWFASNPTTRGQALPRQRYGLYNPGIHDGTGWVPVNDVLGWLKEQINAVFGEIHA